jgi:hypothetical protein
MTDAPFSEVPTMSSNPDEILDDLFLACALAAFLEEAHAQQGWLDSEATRRRAYQFYEEALAEKSGRPKATTLRPTAPYAPDP